MIKHKTKPQMGNPIDYKTSPFTCYVRSKESYEFVIPVIGPIEYNHDFLEAVSLIEQAEEKDTVILKVNSPGGSLAAVDYLLQSLAFTEAHVHADVTGELMSAATLIMDMTDSFNISDNTSVLIHNSVYGEFGKAKDVVDAVMFQDKMNKALLDRYYKHMFSDEEMLQLYEGKQFYMDNMQYIERFEKRQRALAGEQGDNNEEDSVKASGCSCGMGCSKTNHPVSED